MTPTLRTPIELEFKFIFCTKCKLRRQHQANEDSILLADNRCEKLIPQTKRIKMKVKQFVEHSWCHEIIFFNFLPDRLRHEWSIHTEAGALLESMVEDLSDSGGGGGGRM